MKDIEARRRIREDLDATLLVEAAAGTGKTTELVARIVALVREGRARIENILAVTFTDKAAGEMKLRLRGELESARDAGGAAERERLGAALAQLETASIATIHSVCAELLRERPVEARVDPLFEVAPGETADRIFGAAFDDWFGRAFPDPPEGVRRLLRRRPRGRDAPGPREQLRSAGWDLCEHRDFDAPWQRAPFDRRADLRGIQGEIGKLAELAPRALRKDDWLAKSVAELARFHADVLRREALRGPDDDGLEAELHALSRARFWAWRGSGRFFAQGLERAAVVAQRESLQARLESFCERADADLAAALREELRPLVLVYQERKGRAGCLDFLDLLLCARDLVRDDAAVRADLQRRFTHVLVDEFQDTDPLQAELLLLLSADDPAERDWTRARPAPGKLFVVGDPKQSIYRFRRADVALYEEIKERLLARGARLVHLTTSFRAAPSIQEAVNAAFSLRMMGAPDRSQAAYVPLSPYREDPGGRPTIVALPAPRIYGERRSVVRWRIEESYPDAVGAFVSWLVGQSGWTVREREGGAVKIEPRHVCLLFKRMLAFGDDLTRRYVEALEARLVPHVLVGGRSYHDRDEVRALRNAARAIEWPDDELSVFATLRGPLFALGDDDLLTFRSRAGRLHPLRPPAEGTVADALRVLGDLHRGRNHRPIADTLLRLLDATRAHAGLAVSSAGEQALANALRVVDLARRFEAAGATSFRAFVDRLVADEERGETGEAPAVEEGAEGVCIMTVHRAKGLEFPVVILCDPTGPAAPRTPSRYVVPEQRLWAMPLAGCAPRELIDRRAELIERDRAETVRLAYVAATRARDLLVVPVTADEQLDCWLDALHPAVYPQPLERSRPGPAPGCPPFPGSGIVLDQPEEVAHVMPPLRPGLHAPRAGRHGVVFWDPAALELGKEAGGGLRRELLLEKDEGATAAAGERAHAEWQARRSAALAAGAAESMRVTTATALARELPASQVRFESVPREEGRPAGRRFGALVHAVLAHAGGAPIDAVARACGRLLGADEAEIAAAARAARAAHLHPLLVRAAQSRDCRREAPLFLRRPDGVVVEGVADLAFLDEGRWVVVDFKTDARPGEVDAYRAQLAFYAEAIGAATGLPAEAVLLAV